MARTLVTTTLVALLAVGCGNDGAVSGGGTIPTSQGTAAGQPTTTAQERSVIETQPPPTGAIQREQVLTLEQRHPNGTVLKLTKLVVAGTSMTFSVEAVNGYTKKISLNSRGIRLVDDLGNRYNFVKPDQNADLEILPGATLRGGFTFLGVIDAKATTLRLLINVFNSDDNVDLANRSDTTTSPQFLIDAIPIPR